ncbi:uncharacterized protein EV422DRAFT_211899 [Fimicolochytrium jonesii]|uniref:uncharacterized protein n=1 Tax=Fimicolochytrium jonesii TaxID=1396493 RepID=UPI0022FEB9B4|nr:uncharacterized protein EV422DRAFT_211899 [Fimicolochytrium jonesii]KAI8817684.1 hypothetical protein EV422DRAFT_211899 [Fimicolochytrium jonesii]
MEERVRQYHAEASGFLPAGPSGEPSTTTPYNPVKVLRAMNAYRKFIHKNQDFRFTDKDKARLFGAVQAYFTYWDRSQNVAGDVPGEQKPSSLPLIEDALKVPFFTTKQKSTMLKWYEEVHSASSTDSKAKFKQHDTRRDNEDENDDWGDPDAWGASSDDAEDAGSEDIAVNTKESSPGEKNGGEPGAQGKNGKPRRVGKRQKSALAQTG